MDLLYMFHVFCGGYYFVSRAFWRSFITTPFMQKDMKALDAVQTVLEPIILRRTKNMRGILYFCSFIFINLLFIFFIVVQESHLIFTSFLSFYYFKDADGKLLVDLPEKVVEVERLELTDQERDIYESLYKDSKTKFDHYCAAGKVLSSYAHIFQLILRFSLLSFF